VRVAKPIAAAVEFVAVKASAAVTEQDRIVIDADHVLTAEARQAFLCLALNFAREILPKLGLAPRFIPRLILGLFCWCRTAGEHGDGD
jgi:hypothetical protein